MSENYRQLFQKGRLAARLLQVVDLLFECPLVTVHTVETEPGLFFPTEERYINELVKQEILVASSRRGIVSSEQMK